MKINYDKKIDSKCWKEYREFIKKHGSVWGFELPKEKKYSEVEINYALNKFNGVFNDEKLKVVLDSLSKVFICIIKISDISLYITTMPFSTYSEKEGWIAISIRTNEPIKTIAHEINHKFFYESIGRNMPFKEYELIKEYLTIINNDIFKDTLKIYDSGYPEHKTIRRKILKIWKEKKSIKACLEIIG